jgi:hypothetical protein
MEPRNRFRQHIAWWASTSNRIDVPARQAGNRFQGSLKRFTNSGTVGRVDSPIPTRVLAPADCSKIPALKRNMLTPLSLTNKIEAKSKKPH